MDFSTLQSRGIVLLGCGKMGSAMLAGWLAEGLAPTAVWVEDPAPSAWLKAQGVHINAALPPDPATILVAVKPQIMTQAVPRLRGFGGRDTVFLSIAAGTSIAQYEELVGAETPIVRAMPNTPAAIGKGITALIGNSAAARHHMDLCADLLSAIGQVVHLQSESQMDAVTGLSGSGPAYVFHLIETMAAAGVAQGLPETLAMHLAKATVAGAGALAESSDQSPEQLRINVTSPNGTTQAGLDELMDVTTGLHPLIDRTVAAATTRSKELANG